MAPASFLNLWTRTTPCQVLPTSVAFQRWAREDLQGTNLVLVAVPTCLQPSVTSTTHITLACAQ